jgi:GMP synthase (glutamine-hydrolysing)
MIKRVVVLQHEAIEGPGVWAEGLLETGAIVETSLVPVSGIPPSAAHADLVISMGGPMSVNDPLAWIDDELSLLRARIRAGRATLGVCLGAQLIAKAAGGRVVPGPAFEIGFHEVELTEAGRHDAVTGALPARPAVLQWHGEVVRDVPDAVSLARSGGEPMQAFRVARSYGLVFHLEATLHSVDAMSRAFPGDLAKGSLDAATLLDEARRRLPGLHQHARAVLRAAFDL